VISFSSDTTCFLAHEDSKKTDEHAKTTSVAIIRFLFITLYLHVFGLYT